MVCRWGRLDARLFVRQFGLKTEERQRSVPTGTSSDGWFQPRVRGYRIPPRIVMQSTSSAIHKGTLRARVAGLEPIITNQ